MEETYTKGDINNKRDRVEDRGKEEGEDIGTVRAGEIKKTRE
jgi:hypothetical protein